MKRERQGGWVYIMADCYRGTMYVGVTSHLAARASISIAAATAPTSAALRADPSGLGGARRRHHRLHRAEKRLKRWQRQWKFDLIERGNPDWRDLFDQLA